MCANYTALVDISIFILIIAAWLTKANAYFSFSCQEHDKLLLFLCKKHDGPMQEKSNPLGAAASVLLWPDCVSQDAGGMPRKQCLSWERAG